MEWAKRHASGPTEVKKSLTGRGQKATNWRADLALTESGFFEDLCRKYL